MNFIFRAISTYNDEVIISGLENHCNPQNKTILVQLNFFPEFGVTYNNTIYKYHYSNTTLLNGTTKILLAKSFDILLLYLYLNSNGIINLRLALSQLSYSCIKSTIEFTTNGVNELKI